MRKLGSKSVMRRLALSVGDRLDEVDIDDKEYQASLKAKIKELKRIAKKQRLAEDPPEVEDDGYITVYPKVNKKGK